MTKTPHIVMAGLLAVLALGGCGGDDDKGEAVADDRAAARREFQEAGLKFARCMRANGVDIPDPKVGQGGFVINGEGPKEADNPAAERARGRCGKILESVKPPELSEEQQAEMRENALAHARCMREHGVNLPDPRFEGGRAAIALPKGFDPTAPAVRQAERACRSNLPAPPKP